MKKIRALSLVLVFAIALCSFSISVSAKEEKTSDLSYNTSGFGSNSIHITSTSKPNKFWDLSKKNYTADCQHVGPAWLYTNYYFKPNSKGVIYVKGEYFSITGRSVDGLICAYDMTDKKIKEKKELKGIKLKGTTINTTFKSLNKKHNYSIAFTIKSNGWTVDPFYGNATISHKKL